MTGYFPFMSLGADYEPVEQDFALQGFNQFAQDLGNPQSEMRGLDFESPSSKQRALKPQNKLDFQNFE